MSWDCWGAVHTFLEQELQVSSSNFDVDQRGAEMLIFWTDLGQLWILIKFV